MIFKDTTEVAEALREVENKYKDKNEQLYNRALSFLSPEDRKDALPRGYIGVYEGVSEDFQKAYYEYVESLRREASEKTEILNQYGLKEWKKLENDPEKILQDVRETVEIFCDRLVARELRMIQKGYDGSEYSSVKDGLLTFDEEKVVSNALGLVDEHRIFFNHEKDEEIDEIIRKTISESMTLTIQVDEIEKAPDLDRLLNIKPKGSRELVVITSKLVDQNFHDFSSDQGKRVNVQKKKSSKNNPVDSLMTINFDDLPDSIRFNREPDGYDREIHDYVVSRYLEGNEYISDSMIYDVASGKKGATLHPKQKEAISRSMTKMMYSQLWIDASEESKKWGVDEFTYDGPIIPAERVTISMNGEKTECYHIFRTPPLYEYANRLDQVARRDVKLLQSPVNKNEDTIILQGYLLRRILAMQDNKKLARRILYESVYEKIDFSSVLREDNQRKKKKSIRDTTKKILKYWKEQGFIKDFFEINSSREKIEKLDEKTSGRAIGIDIILSD